MIPQITEKIVQKSDNSFSYLFFSKKIYAIMSKRRFLDADKRTTSEKSHHTSPKISHKGTFGRIVLIGGNEQYGGAIIMSALAAVHSGAGLTTVVTDEKIGVLFTVICQKQ